MNIIAILLNILPVVAEAIPGINSTIKQVITDVVGSLGAVVSSGALSNANPTTILNAISGVTAALKSEPNIPPSVLNLIAALDRAAQAALAADQQAQQKVDPTTLKPIEPLP